MWLSLLIETGLWQASLKAEDILNSWPEIEVGRILRVYGEESNWYSLQNKIVKARSQGGLHSTTELVDLIRKSTLGFKGKHCSLFIFFASDLNHIHLCLLCSLRYHHDYLSYQL